MKRHSLKQIIAKQHFNGKVKDVFVRMASLDLLALTVSFLSMSNPRSEIKIILFVAEYLFLPKIVRGVVMLGRGKGASFQNPYRSFFLKY